MRVKELKDIVSVTDCLIANEDHEIFIDPYGKDNYTVTETGVDKIWEFTSFEDMLNGLQVGEQSLRNALASMDLV